MDIVELTATLNECAGTMELASKKVSEQTQKIAALTESNELLSAELTKSMAAEQKVGELLLRMYVAATLGEPTPELLDEVRETLGIKDAKKAV